jgi:hypothetical protein
VVNRRPEAEFLDQLGLRETSDHPLIATFAERLKTFRRCGVDAFPDR